LNIIQKKEEPKVEVKEEPKVEVKKVEEPKVVVKEEPKVEVKKVEEPKVVETIIETKKDEVTVATKEEEEEDEEDVPGLEDSAPTQGEQAPPTETETGEGDKQSRAEKKIRKSMEKLNLKPFKGVTSVNLTVGQMQVSIKKADVYKVGESFLIFGHGDFREMKQGGQPRQDQKTDQLQKEVEKVIARKEETRQVEDEGPVDETGVDSKDIDLVLKQTTGVSRKRAVEALRESKGDLVNAIMTLTNI